jgi:hypothetical protein
MNPIPVVALGMLAASAAMLAIAETDPASAARRARRFIERVPGENSTP